MEKQILPEMPQRQPKWARRSNTTRSIVTVTGTVLAVLSLLFLSLRQHEGNNASLGKHKNLSVVDKVQKCAIDNLHKDLSFLDSAKPITAEEFVDRRDRLARALAESNIDAFVLEPGYTFQ